MSQRKRGPLQLEEFVIGKSKAFKDKLGRLIEMVVINGALKYKIRWDDGAESVVAKTGIQRCQPPEINQLPQVHRDDVDVEQLSDASEDSEVDSIDSSVDDNQENMENVQAEIARSIFDFFVSMINIVFVASKRFRFGHFRAELDENPQVDNLLTPHGQIWVPNVSVEIETEEYPSFRGHFLWQNMHHLDVSNRMPYDYFRLMFPFPFLNSNIVVSTNMILGMLHEPTTDIGEMLKFFGIRLQAAYERNRGDFLDNWSTSCPSDEATRPGNYAERFGMSRDRFKLLSSCFRLDQYNAQTYVDEVIMKFFYKVLFLSAIYYSSLAFPTY